MPKLCLTRAHSSAFQHTPAHDTVRDPCLRHQAWEAHEPVSVRVAAQNAPGEEATRRQRSWTTFSLPTTGGVRCVSWYASRAPSSRRLRSSRRRRRTFRLVFEHPPAMCVTPFLDAV